MRILLAIHNAYTDHTSGAAQSMRIIMEWLADAGHEVRVLGTARFDARAPADLLAHLAEHDISPRRTPPSPAFLRKTKRPGNLGPGRPVADFELNGVSVRMLMTIDAARLQEAAQDPAFLDLYDRAMAGLDEARSAKNTWWTHHGPPLNGKVIAYFSAEFALHQSLPIYAGGLGVLAGDHCKEASDLGVPLVGVGFMYPQGYFHQRISVDGWQQEHYERLDWTNAPIDTALTRDTSCSAERPPKSSRTRVRGLTSLTRGHTWSTARIPSPMMKRPTSP